MSIPRSLDKGHVEAAPGPIGPQESVPLIGQNTAVRDTVPGKYTEHLFIAAHGHNADTTYHNIIPPMHKCDVCIPSSFLWACQAPTASAFL